MQNRVFSRSWIFALAAVAATAGCGKLYMSDQPCPCASGWTCCKNQNVCVKSGGSCPAGPLVDACVNCGPTMDAGPRPHLENVVIASGQAMPGPMEMPLSAFQMTWVDEGSGAVMRWPAQEGNWPPPPDAPVPPPAKLGNVAPGKAALDFPYIADSGDGTISVFANGKFNALATGQIDPRAITNDQDYIYWTTYGHGDTKADGTVARMSREGGAVQVLASGLAGPGPLALSDTYVYFATDGKTAGANEILRVPIAGGQPEVLATGQNHPTGLYSRGALYWATSADASSSGRIMSMSFPVGRPQVAVDDAHHPALLSSGLVLNDDGINVLETYPGTNTPPNLQLLVPLAPEPGRSSLSLPGGFDHHSTYAWTNPNEGNVIAQLPRQ